MGFSHPLSYLSTFDGSTLVRTERSWTRRGAESRLDSMLKGMGYWLVRCEQRASGERPDYMKENRRFAAGHKYAVHSLSTGQTEFYHVWDNVGDPYMTTERAA